MMHPINISLKDSVTTETPAPDIHRSFISGIFYQYGFTAAKEKYRARRNKITGNVELLQYNETFQYWCWVNGTEKAKTNFIRDNNYWK